MGYLSLRTPLLHYSILGITLFVSYITFSFPEWTINNEIVFVIALVVLFGIPHGAADCLVLKCISHGQSTNVSKRNFYAIYILLVVADIICWCLRPLLALTIFIVISIYHLGQSNLYYLTLPRNNLIKAFVYCCWGAFVIFVPILFNAKEVIEILGALLDKTWLLDLPHLECLIIGIIALNILILGMLAQFNYITTATFWQETVNLFVLALLFRSTPLIVSFGIYFTLWHSLSSTLDQVNLICQFDPTFNLAKFYTQAAPLAFISILIFVLIEWIVTRSSWYRGDVSTLIALFFIGLAAITSPHAVIRDRLYKTNLTKQN